MGHGLLWNPRAPLSIKKWDLCFRFSFGLIFVTPMRGVGVGFLLVQLSLQRLGGSWTVPSPKHPRAGFGLSLPLPQDPLGWIMARRESLHHCQH